MKDFLFALGLFNKFGRVKDVQIVIDKKTNKSRGFGFVYFDEVESATRVNDDENWCSFQMKLFVFFKAKEALNATEFDHHRLRIDFSVTKRAHTPSKFYFQVFLRSFNGLFFSTWNLYGCSDSTVSSIKWT